MALVDAPDGEHSHEDLHVGDLARVTGEERLDLVWSICYHHEVYPRSRNVHAGQLVDELVDLRDHDPVAKGGGLDDGRGVLRVRTRIEVALGVSRLGGHQRDGRDEVDEEAGVELEVSVDRANTQLAVRQ